MLFARKPIDRAAELGAKAAEKKVRIIAIAMGADEGVRSDLSALAEASGGQCLSYSAGQLANWVRKAPPLD